MSVVPAVPSTPEAGRSLPARFVAFLYAIAAVALGTFLLRDAFVRLYDQGKRPPWDFMVDLRLARAFIDGYNPYTPAGAHRAMLDFSASALGHPPSTAFWALPFARFEDTVASAFLACFSMLMLLVMALVMAREHRWPMALPSAWLAFAAVLHSQSFEYQAAVGQLSTSIGFCLWLAWLALRSEDQWLAGTALGIACSMKPFPAVVVLLFLVRKRWTAVGIAVTVFLAIGAVMTSRFGIASWSGFLAAEKVISALWLGSVQNQSLHGIVERLVHPTCQPWVTPDRVVTLASSAASALLIGAASWLAWRLPRTLRNDELLLAAFTVLALFVSPLTWEHYSVMLFMPAAILIRELAQLWPRRTTRVGVALGALCLGISAYTVSIPMGIKIDAQRAVHAGDQTQHVKLHVYEALNSAHLVLLTVLAFALVMYSRRRSDSAEHASHFKPSQA